jgi:predicted N-acetyltransferase YhbS
MAFRIEAARADDLAKLPAIERAANQLFVGSGVTGVRSDDVTALDELSGAFAARLLLVAREASGEPIGFALLEANDDALHLEELDVHPAHGRRGAGRALLDAVLARAARGGYPVVTLTTFRDLPWNAPFYARTGFRALAPGELGPGLAGRERDEAARGLDPAQRVAMRYDLAIALPPR